jgi:cob(I)alamin adenosyltransferase
MQKGFKSSEVKMLEKMENIDVLQVCTINKFSRFLNGDEKKEYAGQHREGIRKIIGLASQGAYDMVVVDEAIGAINEKALKTEDIKELIQKRSPGCEIVLSGRNAPEELITMADYVSKIDPVKHPYEKGVKARKGIEY